MDLKPEENKENKDEINNENNNNDENTENIKNEEKNNRIDKKTDRFDEINDEINALVMDPDMLKILSKDVKKKYLDRFKLFTKKKNKSKIPASSLTLLLRGLSKNPKPKQIQKWLKGLNIDPEDGYINKSDFILILRQPNLEDVETELGLREAFRTFDEEETGEINVHDLRKILTECGEDVLTEKEVKEFIEESVDELTENIKYFDFIKIMQSNIVSLKDKKKKKKKSKKKK